MSVSFNEGGGVAHSTEVLVGSVLEAAAEPSRVFREQDVLNDDGAFDLCVEVTKANGAQGAVGEAPGVAELELARPENQALQARLR